MLIVPRLIAIMLGRLRMSVERCLSELSKLTVDILKRSRTPGANILRRRREQDGRKLQEGLIRLVQKRTGLLNDNEYQLLPLKSPGDLCKT